MLLTRGYVGGIRKAVQQVPLNSTEAQVVLIKALELPLPDALTKIAGIHQSDVIIRSALTAALADIRANPWLLDYVFASLPQDQITWKEYGEKSLQQAKEWFLKTNVPVKLVPVLNELEAPCITISLVESSEAVPETTTSDTHYEPFESNGQTWPALTKPFTPSKYLPATGIVTLKKNTLPTNITLAAGMFIIDKVGRPHEILEVYDERSFKISPNTVADFRNSVIKSRKPSWVTSVESSSFRETYRIGVHVGGEPVRLTWLHSIVVFALLRYKEALLEARGFERSTFQSSDFARENQFETELVFSRFLNVSGYVRQYWPKVVAPVIDAVRLQELDGSAGIAVSGVTSDGETEGTDVTLEGTGTSPDEALWAGNLDSLTSQKKK